MSTNYLSRSHQYQEYDDEDDEDYIDEDDDDDEDDEEEEYEEQEVCACACVFSALPLVWAILADFPLANIMYPRIQDEYDRRGGKERRGAGWRGFFLIVQHICGHGQTHAHIHTQAQKSTHAQFLNNTNITTQTMQSLHQRRSKNFHLTRLLLKHISQMSQAGE